MAGSHPYTPRATLSEDQSGVVHAASEGRSEHRVLLRIHSRGALARSGISAAEQVAYQVAVRRLSGIAHASLHAVLAGGCDEDGIPYLVARYADDELLSDLLRRKPLPAESAMALCGQLLEVCELLSHVLAEESIWVELDPAAIGVRREAGGLRFVFWPAPLRNLGAQGRSIDFAALAALVEAALGLAAGGHANHALGDWLDWLRSDAPQHKPSLREMREVLAAAAGVEPPPPIQALVASARRKLDIGEALGAWFSLKRLRQPKMPLFTLLSIMLVVQSALGWLVIREINLEFDRKVYEINQSAYGDDPSDMPGGEGPGSARGSKPLGREGD